MALNNIQSLVKSKTLPFLLTLGILSLMAVKIYGQWQELPPAFFSEVNMPLLLLSLVILIPSIFINSFRWTIVLKMMNASISWLSVTRIWYQSQAGRFLPGGLWNYVARFYLSQKKLDQNTIVTSMFIETIIRVISELLIFLITLPFFQTLPRVNLIALLCIILILIFGIFLLKPTTILQIRRLKLFKNKFEALEQIGNMTLKPGNILLLLAYNVLTGLLVLFAFYFFVKSFFPLTWGHFPMVIGSLSASIVFSFLIPFVPNGWGVREGVLTILLNQLMPLSVAAIIAVSTRVWLTIGEAILISLSFLRNPNKNNP